MGWVDDPHWDDPDGRFWNPGSEPRRPKICKYCGCIGLHWVQVENKWKLYDKKDNLHLCQKGLKKI